jgi:hypothetical protein
MIGLLKRRTRAKKEAIHRTIHPIVNTPANTHDYGIEAGTWCGANKRVRPEGGTLECRRRKEKR